MIHAQTCSPRLQACHLLPQDGSLRFNLALSNQQFAQLVSDLPEDQRSIEVLEQAKEYIEMAQSVFGELRASKESAHKLGYDPQMAAQREKHCDYVRNSVIRRLAQQKANEELKQDKLAELKRARDEEERARQQRAEEERLKREQHEQALLDKRRQMQMELLSEQLKREEEAKRRRETNAARVCCGRGG